MRCRLNNRGATGGPRGSRAVNRPTFVINPVTRSSAMNKPLPEGISMTQHSHQTAPTQFVEANGIRFAYRRFGNAAGVPLVFNQHYLGTMDYWDPAVTDGLARGRAVIL